MKPSRSLVLGLALGIALLTWALAGWGGTQDGSAVEEPSSARHTADDRPVETFAEAFFTDMAFKGKIAYQGTWIGGFRTVNIAAPGKPKVLAEVDCGFEQGDIGVYRNLVFRSIDVPIAATTPEETCSGEPAESGFEGIQIFQVDDPKEASADDLVGAVATDCGSHTQTVVPTRRMTGCSFTSRSSR